MACAWTPCRYVPHGSVGRVSRENLNAGNLDSTAAQELYATYTYSKRVTTEQFRTGCGLCGQAPLLGGGDNGGYHTLLGRWKT